MDIDIEQYYRTYGPMVLRRCRFLLHDEDRAYDAMQEVFVKILMNRERLTGEYPSGLLYRIATNICLNMLRSEKKFVSCEALAEIAHYDIPEERIITGDLLDRIFEQEKASTREMAVMFYIDGMTYGEIAEETGISVSGVRKRLRNLKDRARSFKGELS